MTIVERSRAASAPAPLMSALRVSLLGALFVAIGPFAMALYTPAMTEIVQAFDTSNGVVKMTLTLYFAGFACAQLIAGPVSDALGRRPVIMLFMVIFVLASLLAVSAQTIEVLLAARFLQGVGASAGVAISRAIVRDQFQGDESSRIMNLIGIILAIAPALAPTVGGFMVVVTGWRSLFMVMTVFGFVVMLFTWFGLRETVIPDKSRLNLRALMRSYGTLATNWHFMAATLTVAGSVGSIYTLTTILPFVLMDELGLSPSGFGLSMLCQSGSFFLGSLTVRALMSRYSAYRLVAPGLGLIALGSFLLATLLFGQLSFIRVMGPIAIYAFGVAFVMPAMTTTALAPFPRIAGAASALMGFLQMGSGLVMGSLAALFSEPVTAAAVLVPAMGATAVLSYVVYRTHPHLAEREPRKGSFASMPPGRSMMPDDSSDTDARH